MFTLDPNPTFTVKVDIKVPIDGGHELQSLDVTYRVISDEELASFDVFSNDGQKDYLRAVIVGLGDITNEDGDPVPYSDAVRDKVIGLPYARHAIFTAFHRALVPELVKN